MNHRPDDRVGGPQHTVDSKIRRAVYRSISRLCHHIPNFRGKVRAANAAHTALGLANQHILTRCNLKRPTSYKAILDSHSWHERLAFLESGYEPQTARFLARLFKGTGSFIDVGANIGLIAIPFTKLVTKACGVTPKSFCVEAITSNAERLKKNIQINELQDHMRVLTVGVGDTEKQVEIQVEGNLSDGAGTGTANIMAEGSSYDCERIKIDITTLDNLVLNSDISGDCSLMKIDVDGYDLKVILGASKLLKSSRPIVYGEFSEHCMKWHDQSHEDVFNFARSLGYRSFARVNHRFQFCDAWGKRTTQDLLLIPEEWLGEVSWCLQGL